MLSFIKFIAIGLNHCDASDGLALSLIKLKQTKLILIYYWSFQAVQAVCFTVDFSNEYFETLLIVKETELISCYIGNGELARTSL